MPRHEYPGFWENLDAEETRELMNSMARVKNWVMYVEKCRKDKTPIDYSKEPSNELYFRQAELRDKLFLPKKV